MTTDPSKNENNYIFDAESGTEMTRLLLQDRLLTQGMGGVFPPQFDLSHISTILDIGCGPGGWVLDVAFEHPEITLVGIDISQRMTSYAQTQAKVQGLDNTRFAVMDATKPLDFPANTFDFIHARLMQGFMRTDAWPKLLKECLRILRPGGFVRLIETEWGISNSLGHEKMVDLFTRAMYRAGQSFSPTGRQISITPMLPRLLKDAGYTNIQQEAHVINHSAGTPAHDGFYQNYMVGFKTSQPFFVKMGVTTLEEVEEVYQQMLIDMTSDDFCALWFLLSAWGRKPEEEAEK